ncbi:MAG: Hsp20/alpha crystallin family protein, partial [Gammaproteobacteria bacterium]|nr:Hsp20/alpha crystallin family protein [Gammaproteobacteria bacterium]
MNLVNWTPVRDMEGFFDRYNNTMAPRARPGGEVGKAIDWRPSVDISETNKDYLIKVELPEVEKDGVQV